MKKKTELTLNIYSADGALRHQSVGENHCELLWTGSYEPGDYIRMDAAPGTFARIQLDLLIKPAFVYLQDGTFTFEIPFGRAKEPYPQEAFTGLNHQLTVEAAAPPAGSYLISENSLDIRGESRVFPHCTASVETRGESVFAARNTIDGLLVTQGHGFFPYTSWGEGEDADAHIDIFFGRKILAEEVQIFLRSDFPHDNYWKEGLLTFSDGSSLPITLQKTGKCQSIFLPEPLETEWVRLSHLKKDPADPSPFPALTQWRVMGREC